MIEHVNRFIFDHSILLAAVVLLPLLLSVFAAALKVRQLRKSAKKSVTIQVDGNTFDLQAPAASVRSAIRKLQQH